MSFTTGEALGALFVADKEVGNAALLSGSVVKPDVNGLLIPGLIWDAALADGIGTLLGAGDGVSVLEADGMLAGFSTKAGASLLASVFKT